MKKNCQIENSFESEYRKKLSIEYLQLFSYSIPFQVHFTSLSRLMPSTNVCFLDFKSIQIVQGNG